MNLDGGAGLEPAFPGSKPGVLPLDEPPRNLVGKAGFKPATDPASYGRASPLGYLP